MTKFSEIKYQRPETEQLYNQTLHILKELKISDSFEETLNLLSQLKTIETTLMDAMVFLEIKVSQNTQDDFHAEEKKYLNQEFPKFSPLSKEKSQILLSHKFRKELEDKYGKYYFEKLELVEKTSSDTIIALVQKELELTDEYEKIMSDIEVEFEGKKYNYTGMTPLMENLDRDYRKRANKALMDVLITIQPKLDDIYDKLVKIRHQIALALGYENFVQLGYDRMGRTCYNSNDVAKFRDLVCKHFVPLANEYKEKIRQTLGFDKIYQYDEIKFKDGNPTPKTSPKQMIEDAQIMYREMSKETGEFFDKMIENETMDLLNRDHKRMGGYCTFIDKIKSPFIFSNFNGTSFDVDVLTHEAGHAFQVYCSKDFELNEYLWPTSESAEIHSMSMEFFAWNWVDKFFKNDTNKYKLSHLLKTLFFMPYGISVDEFQEKVYLNPELNPKQRRELWNSITGKYLPWLDIDDAEFLLNGGRWQLQAHIFAMPFYYIDYALAQMCAYQFHDKMNKNYKEAWNDYFELCKKGGSMNFLDLLKVAKIGSPFENDSFEAIVVNMSSNLNKLYKEFYSSKNS